MQTINSITKRKQLKRLYGIITGSRGLQGLQDLQTNVVAWVVEVTVLYNPIVASTGLFIIIIMLWPSNGKKLKNKIAIYRRL